MNRLFLSGAALALTAGAALAADLPSRKDPIYAPPPPPPPMWTGFYVGLNAGYGFGANSYTQGEAWSWTNWQAYTDFGGPVYLAGNNIASGQFFGTSSSATQSGFIGGGQIGYNYQINEKVLLGFETDFQGTTISGGRLLNGSLYGSRKGEISPIVNHDYSYYANQYGAAATNNSSGLNYLGTARGRVGYIFTPTLLVYATGGLAYGSAWGKATSFGASDTYVNYPVVAGDTGYNLPARQIYLGSQTSRSSLLAGYSAGGGFEWMFMPNWSVKAEALYYNLGNMSLTTAGFAGATVGSRSPNPNFTPENLYTATGEGLTATTVRVNYQGIIARAGVNYHFNWGAAAPIFAN